MKYFRTAALCSVLAFAAWPATAEDKSLSHIDVKVDLSAYADSNAMEYWPSLQADIAQEIAARVTLDDTSDAPRVRVEINKVAINGETYLPEGGEFNQLEGTVQVLESLNEGSNTAVDEDTGKSLQSFPLVVSALSSDTPAPEGVIVLPPSKDDFYNALVTGYAAETVKHIDQ